MLFQTSTLLALAAAVFGAAVIRPKVHYKIPESMAKILAQDDGCILPAAFEISNFTLWAPDQAANNTNSPLIEFTYADEDTEIVTNCQYNTSSVDVGPGGATPRFACDNALVQFIWESDENALTMVEKACPDQAEASMEASGQVSPDFTCVKTDTSSPNGVGTTCFTKEAVMEGVFSSLQPTPRTPPHN